MSTIDEALPVDGRLAGISRRLGRVGKELWADKTGLFGSMVIVFLILTSIFAPLLAPYDPTSSDLSRRLVPPAWQEGGSSTHLLGTDSLGRDVLSRTIYGSRTSLVIGAAVVLLAGVFGTVMGLIAGYFGRRWDWFIMRWVDTQLAFPGLLIYLVVFSVIRPSVLSLIIVLPINGWMVYAQITRGVVLSAKEMPYVEAAQVVGARSKRLIFRHILPNLASPLLTISILEFARIILVEAALSFLGLGIQPPQSSWGLDVSVGRDYIFNAWWLVTIPGIAIALTVLGVNLFASWLRLISDPQEREKRWAAGSHRGQRVSSVAEVVDPVPPTAPHGIPLLEVEGLEVQFFTRRGTVQAVRGASFSMDDDGRHLGLVGESGSGKSVTAAAIMGLIDLPGEITGGDIRWKGRSLLGKENREYATEVRGKEISIVFQDPMTSLNPLLRIGTQLTEALIHQGSRRNQAWDRAAELLDLVGIESPRRRMKQYPHELSGGMNQRVIIAMALTTDPKLLIADEPTTALDVTIQAQILELFSRLQDRLGLSVFLITHDLGVVAGLCKRVAVMYAGRIVEFGSVEDVFIGPGHPYVAGLLQSTPRLDIVLPSMVSIPGAPPDLLEPPEGCAFHPRCPLAIDKCLEVDPILVQHEGRSAVACHRAFEINERRMAFVREG